MMCYNITRVILKFWNQKPLCMRDTLHLNASIRIIVDFSSNGKLRLIISTYLCMYNFVAVCKIFKTTKGFVHS